MKISNGLITAQFKPAGAEITSLKKGNVEYLWQSDPKHWGRHAPVLFPIVGKLKNNEYAFAGQTFEMGQHGFARDMEFEVESHTVEHITFILRSSENTLKKYPFPFVLKIAYFLSENALETKYEIHNPSSSEMYFSIGGHPAFNCPMTAAESRSDYWLRFDQQEKLESHLLKDGVFNGETFAVPMDHSKLYITNDLFDRDALVFKNLNSDHVTLESELGKWLTFHFEGFPYLGIWSKSDKSPFVCIEPWFGLADHSSHDGDFIKKEGIQRLEPKDVFSCVYKVELH